MIQQYLTVAFSPDSQSSCDAGERVFLSSIWPECALLTSVCLVPVRSFFGSRQFAFKDKTLSRAFVGRSTGHLLGTVDKTRLEPLKCDVRFCTNSTAGFGSSSVESFNFTVVLKTDFSSRDRLVIHVNWKVFSSTHS